MNARPFLKWAGGKTQLLPELLKRVPPKVGAYFEPFLGGGALFFALRPKIALLGDANPVLVRTYRAVRDHVENVIGLLQDHAALHVKLGADHFYAVRRSPSDHLGDVGVAAWMIYLNKTAFNGLWRVNKSGEFNVPFGRYKNPTICDAENLRACSAALQGVEVVHADFRKLDQRFTPFGVSGDFTYADPPYAPLSATSNFTGYTAGGFGPQDQQDLRDLALRFKERGVGVMISNSSAEVIEKLYRGKGFIIAEVAARRAINSKVDKRGPVREYIIT